MNGKRDITYQQADRSRTHLPECAKKMRSRLGNSYSLREWVHSDDHRMRKAARSTISAVKLTSVMRAIIPEEPGLQTENTYAFLCEYQKRSPTLLATK